VFQDYYIFQYKPELVDDSTERVFCKILIVSMLEIDPFEKERIDQSH